ncbi:MAG TPA: hypothetical protein VM370_10735 [Candidatus Thermoplasmatota archaeon]|nr:hypothetical protein [Candidatus Thermoplasmatota archaeon]
MTTKLLILCLLATALVPAAAADPVCLDADTCANVTSSGDGCEGANDGAERGVHVDDGSQHASVSSYCYTYDDGFYAEEDSGLAVGYYSFDENTGEYKAAGVAWYGYSWSFGGEPGEPYCTMTEYTYGFDPVPNGGDGLDCVAGTPPLLPGMP